MYRRGHYGVALLCYAPIGWGLLVLGYPEAAVTIGIGVLLSTRFPDVDTRIPFLTHRGGTHTVIFALGCGLIIGGVFLHGGRPDLALLGGFAGTFGILAHLLGDALTPAGIRPFWPISDVEYSLAVTAADSRLWNSLLFGLGCILTAGGLIVVRSLGLLS